MLGQFASVSHLGDHAAFPAPACLPALGATCVGKSSASHALGRELGADWTTGLRECVNSDTLTRRPGRPPFAGVRAPGRADRVTARSAEGDAPASSELCRPDAAREGGARAA